jgi:branched-chain amino acid transport system substrate-binding protein
MLPFSGELGGYGQDIYNGAVIAAEELRQEADLKLTLTPYDTKGDPLDAARIAAELTRDEMVLAAIGPLTSEEAAVTSAALACRSLPVIVPAATQAGLTRLSEGTFQLSPNIERQGIRMARYAVDSLHADTAVIMTSTSSDHLRMARAFAKKFEQLGGTVAAVEYYRSRDKDFGPYLRDIKALLWGLPPDSIFFTNAYGDTLDPDGIPVTIDCMYLPGSPHQLHLLLPQIRFYKLQTVYLGSDAWADPEVLRLGDDVTRGAVFPSPFLGTDNSEEYLRFAAAFDTRFGSRPPRLAAIGYDAFRLVGLAAREAGGDRGKLTAALTATSGYRGAAGRITLSAERENGYMPLYRIVGGEAEPLSPQTAMADEAETETR